jgi:hypothetical protein
MAGGKRVGKPQGKIAKGCGAVMANRRKRTKIYLVINIKKKKAKDQKKYRYGRI